MKKGFFKILISLIFVANLGFAEYVIEGGKIYYKDKNFKSLVFKEKETRNSEQLRKEIFYPDMESFKILDENYAIDKDSVFFHNSNITRQNSDIENVDLSTFEIINETLSKDKNNVYKWSSILTSDQTGDPLDIKTFSIIKSPNGKINYVKDKNGIYDISMLFAEKLEGIKDENTFRVLGDVYTEDKYNIYYYDVKIKNVDKSSFKTLGNGYGRDKNNIFYNGEKLKVDAGTFYIFKENENFGKDSKNVYYVDILSNNEKIEVKGADVSSFEVLNKNYAIDKYRGYYIENSESSSDSFGYVYYLDDLNVKNVKVLNNYYIKDDKSVYCLGVKVKEADALTFKVKNSFSSEAQDKNHKYEYCKVIK